MTDIVPVPAAPTVPIYPALGSSNFNQEAYDYGSSMPAVSLRIWEIGKASETNATAAKEQATLAAQAVSDAGGSSSAAAAAAAAAADSAAAASQSETNAGNHEANSASSAAAAQGSSDSASQSAADSAQSATESASSAAAAEAFRDEARTFATQQIQGSSTTSVTPGAGSKTWVIEANRSFVPGMYLVATSTTTPGTRMSGYVSSYNSATGQLVIAVDEYSGSAAAADWAIGVSARGANGMAQEVITADTTAVAGVVYIFAGDAVLTLPTTGLSDGDSIGIRLAAPVSYSQIVDFGSIQLRGQAAGERYLDRKGFSLDLKYNATLGEWV